MDIAGLSAVVGPENIRTGGEHVPSSWPQPPAAAVLPGSIEEIARTVSWAQETGAGIVCCGGRTQLQTGYSPLEGKTCILLDLSRLNEVVDYQPDDLTVTCQPGVTLDALQRLLATRSQCLALDVPLAERATVGGIVSTNRSGFQRPSYGTPRDLVIGVRAVISGGVVVKGGGRVVKNVAGYDVCKLFTGAFGTLGVVAEATFKVRPLPESERVVAWETPNVESAAILGFAIHQAQLAVTYLLATNETAERAALVVCAQGPPGRVAWQMEQCAELVAAAGLPSVPRTLDAAETAAHRNSQARTGPDEALCGRLSCLPSDLASLAARLEADGRTRITAHVSVGSISFALLNADAESAKQLNALVPEGAHLVWTRIDSKELAQSLPVWGERRADFLLHQGMKRAIDPDNTFSPGRFYGRI